MFNDFGDILTIDELMECLQIGRNTAYRLINSGEIKSVRVGRKHRIPREQITEYIIRQCQSQ